MEPLPGCKAGSGQAPTPLMEAAWCQWLCPAGSWSAALPCPAVCASKYSACSFLLTSEPQARGQQGTVWERVSLSSRCLMLGRAQEGWGQSLVLPLVAVGKSPLSTAHHSVAGCAQGSAFRADFSSASALGKGLVCRPVVQQWQVPALSRVAWRGT